jgi:hypothetical protein
LKQQEPFGLRIGPLRLGGARHTKGKIPSQTTDITATPRDVAGQHVAVGVLDQP